MAELETGFIVRSYERLRSMLLRTKVLSDEGNILNYKKDANSFKGIYRADELDVFKSNNSEQQNASDIDAYLRDTSANTTDIIKRNRNLNALIPELIPAATIWESSIIAPVDGQTNSLGFSLDLDYIDDEPKKELINLYEAVFNKELKMEDTLIKAINECLFGAGSFPIMVLPQQNLTMLKYAVDLEQFGQESLLALPKHKIEFLDDDTTPTLTKIKQLAKLGEVDCFFGMESLNKYTDPASMESIDYLSRIESELYIDNESTSPEAAISMEAVKSAETIKHVTGWVKDLKDHIVVSKNVSMITSHKQRTENTVKRLMKDFNKDRDTSIDMFNEMFYGPLTQKTMNMRRGVITVSDDVVDTYNFPLLVTVPPECVIPVGTTEETIGYLVLTDNWVSPMSKSTMGGYETRFSNNLVDMSVNAVYGTTKQGPNGGLNNLQKYNAAMTVFDVTIAKLLENKLDQLGLSGMTIGRHQMIGRCLFHHLLQKKDVGLIFVPNHLMVYFAVDYRPDGTGKSLLENIEHALSMRSTLLVSKLLAMTRAAVEKTKITIDMAKNLNPLQTLRLVQNTFYSKNSLRLSNDPDTIVRNIFDSRIQFIPKNLPGAPDFQVETSPESTATVKPDEEMLEYYDRSVMTGLLVPRTAIQETESVDYATSIVSKNLHFANVVRRKRDIFLSHMDKLIKTVCVYSSYMKTQIKEILSKNYIVAKDTKDSNLDKDVTDESNEIEPIEAPETLDSDDQPPVDKESNLGDPKTKSETEDPNSEINASLNEPSEEEQTPEESELPEPEFEAEKPKKVTSSNGDVIASSKTKLSEKDLDQLCVQVIYHMKPTLPIPTVIKNKAEFDEITNYMTSMDTILEAAFAEDLIQIDDMNLKAYYKAHKAKTKRDLMFKFIERIGKQDMFEIPDTKDLGPEWFGDLTQTLISGSNFIIRKKKVLTPTPPEEGGDTGGGGNAW